MSGPMLEVDALNAWYGAAQILFDLSFQVGRGEVVALMGRNGAGKSTLLRVLVGLVTPVSGAVDASGLTPVRTKPKDLVKAVKGNAIVPTYVLEYLLGHYCATSDEASIQSGIEESRSSIMMASLK